jgi:DNA-binding NarL/FixJ family response regulator
MQRSVPLIVVASASAAFANEVAARLRRQGNVVYVTRSADGCLRVATSVAPDVVLIDPAFPRRLEQLLRAHPGTAHAQILHLAQDSLTTRPAIRVAHAA